MDNKKGGPLLLDSPPGPIPVLYPKCGFHGCSALAFRFVRIKVRKGTKGHKEGRPPLPSPRGKLTLGEIINNHFCCFAPGIFGMFYEGSQGIICAIDITPMSLSLYNLFCNDVVKV
jgi:hypothetical protein